MTQSSTHPHVDLPNDIPAFLADESWHNDLAPVFRNHALQVELWCDAADPAERNDGIASTRFLFCSADAGNGCETIHACDDWAEMRAFVVAYAAERGVRE